MSTTLHIDPARRKELEALTRRCDPNYANVLWQRKVYRVLIWLFPSAVALGIGLIWIRRGGVNIEGLVTLLIMGPLLTLAPWFLYRMTFTLRRSLSDGSFLDHPVGTVVVSENSIVYRYQTKKGASQTEELWISRGAIQSIQWNESEQHVTLLGNFSARTLDRAGQPLSQKNVQRVRFYNFFTPDLMQTMKMEGYR